MTAGRRYVPEGKALIEEEMSTATNDAATRAGQGDDGEKRAESSNSVMVRSTARGAAHPGRGRGDSEPPEQAAGVALRLPLRIGGRTDEQSCRAIVPLGGAGAEAVVREQDRERGAAELLASDAYGSTGARVQAFMEQGGGCRATFFNYRRRLTRVPRSEIRWAICRRDKFVHLTSGRIESPAASESAHIAAAVVADEVVERGQRLLVHQGHERIRGDAWVKGHRAMPAVLKVLETLVRSLLIPDPIRAESP